MGTARAWDNAFLGDQCEKMIVFKAGRLMDNTFKWIFYLSVSFLN